jgi:cardiolipin synthase A/B
MPHAIHTGHLLAGDKPEILTSSATRVRIKILHKPPEDERPPAAIACLLLATVGVVGILLVLVLWGGCGLTPGASQAAMNAPATLTVGPDDGPTPILDTIRGARRRILLEMYMLTSPEAVSALAAAHAAGVEVRVLLEPMPFGAPDANLPAFAALAAAGVDVRWAARPTGLVHTKLLVTDDRTATVMSLNMTSAGLSLNREYAVGDTSAADVRWAQAIWSADAVGSDPGPPPVGTRLIASPVDSRARLTAAIESARVSVAIEMEELSDADIVARLVGARARGLAVTVVAPASDTSAATTAALRTLEAGGVTVRRLAVPTLHAKAMVIDRRLAYVGSINFTRASLDDNREVGIILDTPALVARVAATIAADAGAGAPL